MSNLFGGLQPQYCPQPQCCQQPQQQQQQQQPQQNAQNIDPKKPHQQVIFFHLNNLMESIEIAKNEARAKQKSEIEISAIAETTHNKLKSAQNWFYDYNAFVYYENKIPFSIKPKENILILPKNYQFYNELSHEIKFNAENNKMEVCDKGVYHLCVWVTNNDENTELYIQEKTSLNALLVQPEIGYGFCHIPVTDLNSYFLKNLFDYTDMSSMCSFLQNDYNQCIPEASPLPPTTSNLVNEQFLDSSNSDSSELSSEKNYSEDHNLQHNNITSACIKAATAAANAAEAAVSIASSLNLIDKEKVNIIRHNKLI